MSQDIERTLATTATSSNQILQSAKGPVIRWDELNLRRIEGKDEQIAAFKKWGRLRNAKIKTD